ncbi:Putative oxidoreductase, short chain dehydrogenase/reductase family OS=Streptomyces glaucescens OX=1907 GN=SGLAU_28785 PE=3 SV=1 [Streptomyces glaucescens]
MQRALDTNLFGAWRVTQALLPLLERSPHPRIVNVSSETGSLQGMTGGTPAYAVSKAALNALTRLHAESCAGVGCWSTPSARAGPPPTWAAAEQYEGAAGVVWAATLPDDGPTAGFFRDGRAVPW